MLRCSPITDSINEWNSAVQAVCGPYETEISKDFTSFVGQVASGKKGGLPFARLRTNAARVRRSPISGDRDSYQNCVLLTQNIGQARVTHCGVVYDMVPGDIVLLDGVGECEIEPIGLIEHLAISLPRADVARRMRPGRSPNGIIEVKSACGRLLMVLMRQLLEELDPLMPEEDESILCAILCLVGAAIQQHDETPSELPGRGEGSELRLKAERLIQKSIAVPNLSPALIARSLNVSLRQLYRSFEGCDGSIYQHILSCRLRACASDLIAPVPISPSITEIAYRWGFSDSGNFSRAFKREFGLAPRDYRLAFFNQLHSV